MQLTASSPQYAFAPVMMAGGGDVSTAQNLANRGRGGDSMLVHMNPQEVAGLQALAMRQGGSLTINPKTGLPEAFNLQSILPMVAGAALTPIMGPAGAALAVGGLGAIMTGSIEQGLMMGLGAFGGANMAGSFANLAAPAADVTAAAAANSGEFAAQQALSQKAAQDLAIQQAASLPDAMGAPIDVFGNVLGIDEMAVAGGQGVSKIAGLPANVPTLPQSPVSGISKLFQPDENVTYGNIGTGMKNVFSSGENAMKFLGDNKMNLAMSAAPMLFSPEEEVEIERQRAMIRPYKYQVDNLSGAPVDPFGTEAERLRGRFVAGTPYYAAKGGLMSFAEGGSTSSEGSKTSSTTTTTAPAAQTPSSLLINLSPAEAEVYRNIFAVQQMAGVPLSMPRSMPAGGAGIASLPSMFVMSPPAAVTTPVAPSAPVAYTPSVVGTAPALDTSEKRYIVFDPVAATVAAADTTKGGLTIDPLKGRPFKSSIGGSAYDPVTGFDPTKTIFTGYETVKTPFNYMMAEGGSVNSNSYAPGGKVRKKIDRMGDPYQEADFKKRRGLEEAAKANFAKGGLPPRFLDDVNDRTGRSDGMADRIKARIGGVQEARLADGEFVIPADVVSHLGNGSSKAGAKKLYMMMDRIRKARTGSKKQAPAVKAERHMPA